MNSGNVIVIIPDAQYDKYQHLTLVNTMLEQATGTRIELDGVDFYRESDARDAFDYDE